MKKAIFSIAVALTLAVLLPAEVAAQSTAGKGGKAVKTTVKTARGKVPTVAQAVDLGLPSGTLWAPYNVGATKPGEAGAHFAWGETTAGKKKGGKPYYNWDNYKLTTDGGETFTNCTTDGTLNLENDAAAVNWGGKWQMPTQAQLKELFDNCKAVWKEKGAYAPGSLAGYLLMSKKNGNKIFLPAAGICIESGLNSAGSVGGYWSAEGVSRQRNSAYNLNFNSNSRNVGPFSGCARYAGLSVRPVCPPALPDETAAKLTVPTVDEAVDLGLPSGTLWAPYNMGATKPGEAGAYFAWGETTAGKKKGEWPYYNWDNYKWMKGGESRGEHINKYTRADGTRWADWYTDGVFTGDAKTSLDAEDDAAVVNWGGRWQMPTKAQLAELLDNCTAEWKNQNEYAEGSLAGYLLTSKKNGKTLFLPAAGLCDESGLNNVYSCGSYWSAEIEGDSSYASGCCFNINYRDNSVNYRCSGLSVRPVICPPAE